MCTCLFLLESQRTFPPVDRRAGSWAGIEPKSLLCGEGRTRRGREEERKGEREGRRDRGWGRRGRGVWGPWRQCPGVCVLLLMVACFGLGPDARGGGRVSLLVAAPAVCSPRPARAMPFRYR